MYVNNVVWWYACLGLYTAELLAVRVHKVAAEEQCAIRKFTVGKELDMPCLLTEKAPEY